MNTVSLFLPLEEQGINLKFDFRNMRFKIWLYFVTLTIGVLAMIWLFQMVLLGASFTDMKIEQVKEVADEIETSILTNAFDYHTQNSAISNNVCGLVYNSKGDLLYQVDAIGVGCLLNQKTISFPLRLSEYKEALNESSHNEFSITEENSIIRQDMVIYGRKIETTFENYYVYLNSPLLPMDSTTSILQNQFLVVTAIVFIFFTVVSLLISNRISIPIVKMKKSALKLADGNYDVTFDEGEFTEINDLAHTLNQTSVELKKMEELRRDLIANVSHDIKTPLTMIKAYAEMIRDISGKDEAKREEHLGVILAEVDHLDHLAQDMTTLTQLQSNILTLHSEPFDIVETLRQSLDLVDVMLHQKKISALVYTPEEVLVIGDANRIKQVLINFITNAIKFVGKDHQLIFQILTNQDKVRIEVIDHGPGIAEDDLPYIWDRYYKIDKHHSRNKTGTGLGLSIAAAILKKHDATFGVISKVNEGSTFWFELKYALKPDTVI